MRSIVGSDPCLWAGRKVAGEEIKEIRLCTVAAHGLLTKRRFPSSKTKGHRHAYAQHQFSELLLGRAEIPPWLQFQCLPTCERADGSSCSALLLEWLDKIG